MWKLESLQKISNKKKNSFGTVLPFFSWIGVKKVRTNESCRGGITYGKKESLFANTRSMPARSMARTENRRMKSFRRGKVVLSCLRGVR